MNREQILLALDQGETVRHENFPKAWSIKKEGLNYKWSTGHIIEIELFWKNRLTDVYDKDWSII